MFGIDHIVKERIPPFLTVLKYQCRLLYNNYFRNNLWCVFYHFLNGIQGDTAKTSFKEANTWTGDNSGRAGRREGKPLTRFRGRNPETRSWRQKIMSCIDDGLEQQARCENKNQGEGTSLVVHWLRICLPMQGAWAGSLTWEDPMCCRETNPVCNKRSHCNEKPTYANQRKPVHGSEDRVQPKINKQ